MADGQTSVAVWCDICELKGEEKSASFWCFECDQSFCEVCEVQHRYSKPLKRHTAMSMDNYNALPRYIKSLNSYCTEHDDLLDFYCPDHDEPCCEMCFSGTHGSCARLIPIRQIVKASSHEELLLDHQKSIDEICKFISRLQREREDSLSNFKQQIQDCVKQFGKIRQEMNDHLNEIETNIVGSLKNSFELYSEESEKCMAELLKDEKIALDITRDADILVKYTSSFHTFLAKGELQKIVKEFEKSVQSHQENFPLRGIDLQAIFSLDAKAFFEDAGLDNTLQTIVIPSAVEYAAGSCSHAQLSRVVSKTLDDITLCPGDITMNFRGRFQCNIVGCLIRDLGEYVFCDYSKNKRILIFRPNGLFDRIIKTKGQPCCLASIDKNKLAVTFPNENKVKIIDYHSGSITAETVLEDRCVGIAFNQNKIVVCCSENLYILDFHGNRFHVISAEGFEYAVHLHCFENDILIVAGGSELSWLQKDFSVFRKHDLEEDTLLEGITTDSDNNIYLSCYDIHCVIVMSQNGEKKKVLFNEEDGLNLPTGLCYDGKKNQILVVTNSNQCAHVCDVKR